MYKKLVRRQQNAHSNSAKTELRLHAATEISKKKCLKSSFISNVMNEFRQLSATCQRLTARTIDNIEFVVHSLCSHGESASVLTVMQMVLFLTYRR